MLSHQKLIYISLSLTIFFNHVLLSRKIDNLGGCFETDENNKKKYYVGSLIIHFISKHKAESHACLIFVFTSLHAEVF